MATDAPIAPPAPPPNPAPPAAPPAPAFTTWDSPDGKLNPADYEKLPEDVRWIKDDLVKYGTRDELVRAYANKTALVGKKGLLPLPPNAPPEVVAERKAMFDSFNGVPKEPKDYGVTRPPEIPEQAWNEPLVENFTKWAHENSVNPAAVKKLVAVQLEGVKSQLAQQELYEKNFWSEQDKKFTTQVRTENVPLDKAQSLVERGATMLGLDPKNESDALVLKNANVRLAMMRHALSVGEDTFIQGEAQKSEGGDALSLATDALNNPSNPYHAVLTQGPSHPQYKEVKAKMDGWWRAAAAKK